MTTIAVTAASLGASARRSQPLAAMCRPANVRKSGVLLAGAGVVHGAPLGQVVLGVVLLVLAYGVATVYNDLHDLEIDRANHRDLPLVTGEVTPAQARRLLGGCIAALALLQAWASQPAGILFVGTFLALSWAYSAPRVAVEKRGLAATFLLAACYVTLPLAYGHAVAGAGPRVATLSAATFLGAAALLHKDAMDEDGDRRHGKLTPLVRYGAAGVRRICTALFAAGASLLLLDTRRTVLTAGLLVVAGLALLVRSRRRGPSLKGYYPAACAAVLVAL